MRDRLDEFGDASVAVVTFAPAESLAAHRVSLSLPFPILSDPDRSVYHRFGLERASFRAVYGFGNLRLYGRLLRKGRRLRPPTGDTRQLGGDIVLDEQGRLAAAFRPRSPDLRPPLDELIAALSGAAR